MDIEINNHIEKFSDATLTVAELLARKGVTGGGVAVAVNNKIVGRNDWEARSLRSGDKVVIISAAYGG